MTFDPTWWQIPPSLAQIKVNSINQNGSRPLFHFFEKQMKRGGGGGGGAGGGGGGTEGVTANPPSTGDIQSPEFGIAFPPSASSSSPYPLKKQFRPEPIVGLGRIFFSFLFIYIYLPPHKSFFFDNLERIPPP